MEINLYLQTLKRGWWIVVLTMLIALNGALLFSYLTPPIYEATARFVVSPNAEVYDSSWDVVSSLDTLDRRSIINTYKELLASSSVYGNNVEIQKMGLDAIEGNYVITTVVIPDTNILKLTVTGPDPEIALTITEAIGVQALEYVNELYPVYHFTIFNEAVLQPEPIYPLPLQNAGLALLIGGIVGLSLAFAREQMATTFEKLRERSIIDSVSSAYTREFFVRRVREEIAQDTKSMLSLVFINLRGLEDVSGALPQVIYDRVLRSITKILIRELRGRDIVARWNGSQLAILLPSTPGIAVENTFRRIQGYLGEPIPVNESGDMVVNPDPCIGIVERNQFENSEGVIERAEMAMEKASAFKTAAVVFLSSPFVVEGSEELA
ncbi:MAG: diguanylate cyclase [Anaerolineae bacterium]|jgi:diguanylate cyclase (GGDEF)-like protein|nr:diguanylate cyclase [Anaerolineae bacterium]MBT7189392.1 diguanylate cyclase [Anaerolineae bacterium]MBT7991713.1 diguanylate cyclase [Anaerolineae bacterium]